MSLSSSRRKPVEGTCPDCGRTVRRAIPIGTKATPIRVRCGSCGRPTLVRDVGGEPAP